MNKLKEQMKLKRVQYYLTIILDSSDCRQSPHVKVWTFLVFSTIKMHLYDIHTTKALRFQCFRGIIYMKRGAL